MRCVAAGISATPTPAEARVSAPRVHTEIHRFLPEAAAPYAKEIRRSDPQTALDTVARGILGACFHNSVRPDPITGDTATRTYADELSDMAIAYLMTPGRRHTSHP